MKDTVRGHVSAPVSPPPRFCPSALRFRRLKTTVNKGKTTIWRSDSETTETAVDQADVEHVSRGWDLLHSMISATDVFGVFLRTYTMNAFDFEECFDSRNCHMSGSQR